jgi:hypothetical protein
MHEWRGETVADRGRYLYAVCRGLDPGALAGVLGLSDERVEGVVVADLTGLVSSIDRDEYSKEGLRRNIERLDWLHAAAKGHDEVVQAATALAATAPTRFATIYRDDDGVREWITHQHASISAVLDHVEGHEEWRVRVLTRPSASTAEGVEAPINNSPNHLSHPSRKDVLDAHVVAERVHDILAVCAAHTRRLPPQDPRLTGHHGIMVHNVAYLVATTQSTEFAAIVGEQAAERREVVIDAQGPSPPYSFAMLDGPYAP